jgi:hypothetical protein
MKIYAPVKDFNGWRNNVRFVNGVGETDNAELGEWFRSHGYKVAITEEPTVEVADIGKIVDDTEYVEINKLADEPVELPDFDKMTPNEMRDWMKANGYGSKIGNTRNKEKLLELIRG